MFGHIYRFPEQMEEAVAIGRGISLSGDYSGVKSVAGLGTYEGDILFIKTDGTLWGLGKNSQGELGLGDKLARTNPVQIPGATGVKMVSMGSKYTVFLKENGEDPSPRTPYKSAPAKADT